MGFTEEDLDITLQKITNLEKEMLFMREVLTSHAETIKETQRYIIKLAQNQAELTRRVSHWPFLPVSSERDEE